MHLEAESKVGPYEVVCLLGTGGMGEVYRARDQRLGRDVAVKMLLSSFVADPERLQRFEQEAKAVALLNHPNILQIYDTGIHEGMPFLVMELLEGETLRERMKRGRLPLRKALELGQQIARGLAAAHEKGLTHRDLKPENIFITGDERAKILDFGLAKLRSPLPTDSEITRDEHTLPLETKIGTIVGTVGYMSPEQVNGRQADPRSDIFSFGVILWEMLSGGRPFRGDSAVEIMHAILKDDPPELPMDLQLPVSLQRTLQRCLEKDPRARFQNAQDLAFELENVLLGSSTASRMLWTPPLRAFRRIRPLLLAGAGIVLLFGGVAFWALRESARREPPTLHRLTYRSGEIKNARLTPDARSFVYSLSHREDSRQLWQGRVEGLGARSLELPVGTEILSISTSGEMALRLRNPDSSSDIGILARMRLGGGEAPRELMEKVRAADWGPGGRELAVVRIGENGRQRLEYPLGHSLFEAAAANSIDCPRVSPKGDRVAFTEIISSDNQALSVVDSKGKREILAQGEIQTLAWSPDGRELIYSFRLPEDRQELRAVRLSGRQRRIYSVLGRLSIQDMSPTGKLLLRHSLTRQHLFFGQAGKERELSWLQSSKVADLALDGKGILFAEIREGAGPGGAYFRRSDGSEAVRLGDGDPLVLSPDGKWAVVRSLADHGTELTLLPTGPGEARRLPSHGVKAEWVVFLGPRKLLMGGVGVDGVFRYYEQDLHSGELKPWQSQPGRPEAYCLVAHDLSQVALGPVDGKMQIYSLHGELSREIPGISSEEIPLQWSADGKTIYLGALGGLPAKIWRVDLAAGRRKLWKELMPPDTTGVTRFDNVCVNPEGSAYAYSFMRILTSDLYLMEGWK